MRTPVEDNSSVEVKKRFWKQKDLWIVIGVLCALFFTLYIRAVLCDRPLTIESAASADARPDYANAKGIDFHERFRLRMDETVLPAEENGWRELLQAFGPLALEQKGLAKEVPWDEFPTNERSKEWFETYWTPVCEKFGLDPKAKPTFLDRLDLTDYLLKYGVSGKESYDDSDMDAEKGVSFDRGKRGKYWENGEEKEGVVSSQAVDDCRDRLRRGTWTADEFPTAARWIEENADAFDVFTQAIRKPKLRIPHFYGGEPFAVIETLLPDVQHTREFARLLTIRANYRIGKGDFAGVADDYQTVLLLGKNMLKAKDEFIVESLVGVANIGTALGIGLDDSPTARPSEEDYARFSGVLDEFLKDFDFQEALQLCIRGEHDAFFLPFVQDCAAYRRENGPLWLSRALYYVSGACLPRSVEEAPALGRLYARAAKRSVLIRGSLTTLNSCAERRILGRIDPSARFWRVYRLFCT